MESCEAGIWWIQSVIKDLPGVATEFGGMLQLTRVLLGVNMTTQV
jgi:hypothetical protein